MTTELNMMSQLERRRRMLGMTCRTLADRCGVSLCTVQRVLAGDVPPRLPTLLAIAGALGAEIGITAERIPWQMRMRQARDKARALVSMAQGSAALEAQAVEEDVLDEATDQVAVELLAGSNRRLWAK